MNGVISGWRIGWVIFCSGWFLGSPQGWSAPAPEPPPITKTQLNSQARRCRAILQNSLIKFYLPHSLDLGNGGYFESLQDTNFTLIGEKFLTMQARQLWFFSALALEGYDKRAALDAARHGYLFLNQKMRDPVNGGYYSKVTDEGAIKDPRKHIYLNAFALYGLTAYYRASGDVTALQSAQNLFRILEAKCYDRANGGYNEFFYGNWRPITDPKEPRYVGAIGAKTYNTHLHLMEAFAELYRVWPDELLRRRVLELMHINESTVRIARYDSNVDAFTPNWEIINEPNNLRTSYGHDLECAWLMLDTARALGLTPVPYRTWAESLCHTSIDYGFDRQNGGFFSSGPLGQGADDGSKVFWVQAESLVSMLEMYRLTRNINYYDIFSRTLDFVEKFQVAKEGGWWSTRRADGSADNNLQRTSPWQGAYQSGRAMMLSAKILDELATRLPR